MAQIFPKSFNTIARATLFGLAFFVAAATMVMMAINDSSYYTLVNVVREQPVPFRIGRASCRERVCQYV